MQQFQVPQFITVEDRLIGPLTLKQFFYLVGASGAVFIGWTFLNFFFFVLFALPLALLFVALAFLKISQVPFPTVFYNALNYYLKPHLYLWRKIEEKKPAPGAKQQPPESSEPLLGGVPSLSESKLSDLAWSLDIKERIGRE